LNRQNPQKWVNFQSAPTISSLTGVSGLKVIQAILAGERDPQRLLELCEAQIRKHKAQRVRESLRGTWKQEHLFALRQALSGWQFYQRCIGECDQAIELLLQQMAGPPAPPGEAAPGRIKPVGHNAPAVKDLHQLMVRVCAGKDPTATPGMTDYTLLQTIAEVGTELSRWKTEGHFTAWLGLAPGSHQSGKRRGHQARQRNRAGRLFCVMARSLARSVDKGLGGFYRRLRARRGGLIAN
jgi:transposase